MSALQRTWVSFAAVAAGLIHVALTVGAPLWAALVVGMLGLAEFVWGAITFSRDRPPLPRVALVVALAPGLLWLVGLLTHAVPPTFAPLSLGVATLFTLFVAGMLGRAGLAGRARRDLTDEQPPAPASVVRYTVGLIIGIVVIIALTLPALGATVVGGGDPGGVLSPVEEHGHTR
jgi:hypothetical protein